MMKSFVGYALAFVLAIIVWFILEKFVENYLKGKPNPIWDVFQWITSAVLWSVWIMQDAANIAVFLPRQLSLWEFVGFTSFIFLGLGFLFYMKGDRIQSVVNEKTRVTDVRAATLVDLVYAIILFYFKMASKIPMSTTWVFIGLLAGRELAIALAKSKNEEKRRVNIFRALYLTRKDIFKASIGLVVSLILTLIINEGVRREFLEIFGLI
jgi:hypothetical protein